MTDLEISWLCAEAMGLTFTVARETWSGDAAPLEVWTESGTYHPLTDDAHAMGLVKRFTISVFYDEISWIASWPGRGRPDVQEDDADLNRAICLCVAKMQQSKPTGPQEER